MISCSLFWDGISPPNNEHAIGSRKPANKKKKKIHEIFVNINLIAVDRIPCGYCRQPNEFYWFRRIKYIDEKKMSELILKLFGSEETSVNIIASHIC